MSSIDERVVSMAFENSKFEAGIAQTLASLTKLENALKKTGTTSGLGDIDKSASKVTFSGLQAAIEKVKEKLNFTGAAKGLDTIENQSSRITFGPLSTAVDAIKSKLSSIADGPGKAIDALKTKLGFQGASKGLQDIEAASTKVRFAGIRNAVDVVREKLRFSGATSSFADIDKASSRVRFEGMTSALDGVGRQFGILEGVASVALGNIVSKAALAGGSFAKSFSFGPIKQGLDEYTTNLQSIQTILANTKFQGSTLKDVNAALAELNTYSDQTIYNFSEMAKNIGTFTAAGVDLKTSTESIKGIANLAALSGSNSQQASTAMYQLSQAIASGKVGLQDWNSVVNAGMGGATFQRALAQTAQQMGTISEGALKVDKATGKATINGETFRDSIMAKPGDKPWLTSEVLTSTLKQFTGDLSDAQLKAMGFDEQQIKSIQQTAKTAKEAATQVKTLGQVFDVAKETIGSGWSKTFQLIFGDFDQAKKTFTALSNTINGFINTNANARNQVLSDWAKLGGRKVLIEGIKNVFIALGSVIKPIKDAFRDIFPAKTGKDLFELTKRFRDFAESLKIGPETADKLQRTFRGFFAVLDIGKQVLGEVFGVIKDLFKTAGAGSGGFLDFTGNLGDFLVKADEAVKNGDGLAKVFDKISSVLQAPVKLLGKLATALGDLFKGDTGGGAARVEEKFGSLNRSLSPLQKTLQVVSAAFKGLFSVFSRIGGGIKTALGGIGDVIGDFGDQVASAFKNADYDSVFAAIQTTLIGGIFLTIKKALGGGANIDLGGGFLKDIGGTFKLLNSNLGAMQKNLQAGTLLKIATAIGVLAVSVTALSLIDPKRLASAMTAVTVGLGELFGVMVLLNKIGGVASFASLTGLSVSIIALAFAMDLLAVGITILSKLDLVELGKGLLGITGGMAAMAAGLKIMGPIATGTGPGLITVAIGLGLMAVAMKIFATLSWNEIAKGLAGIAFGLTAIQSGTKLMGPELLAIGPGLIAVAFALNLMAGAMKIFATMKWGEIAKGLAGVAGALIAIDVGTALMGPELLLIGPGLIAVAFALTGIAGAIKLMGGTDIKTLAKGIGAIGASLVVLAGGLTLMAFALPGAAALLLAAGALAVLVPVITVLGSLKIFTLVKGLAAIAATMLVIGAAGVFAAPGLIAIGLGLGALGLGILAAGAGVKLLASGLALLGSDGAKGVAVLVAALTAMIAVFPKMVIDFVKGLVQIIGEIAKLAPAVVTAVVKIIESVLAVVIASAPKMAVAATALITALVSVIDQNKTKVITAGFGLIVALLQGMNDNIGKIMSLGASIIVKFLTGIGNGAPKILAAGVTALLKFVGGITSKLPELISTGTSLVVKLAAQLVKNAPKIVSSAASLVKAFIDSLANKAPGLITSGVNLVVKLVEGLTQNVKRLTTAAVTLVLAFIKSIGSQSTQIFQAGAEAVIDVIRGITAAINNNSAELGAAGADLGIALIQGIIVGMASMAGRVYDKAKEIMNKALGYLKKIPFIASPSKVTTEYGEFLILGLAVGMDNAAPAAYAAAKNSAQGVLDTFSNVLEIRSPSKKMEKIGQYVNQGFVQGLLGSTDQINSAFTTLSNKLKDKTDTLENELEAARKKRNKLLNDKTRTADQNKTLQEQRKIIEENTTLITRLNTVSGMMKGSLKAERDELIALAHNYKTATDKVKAGIDVLNTAIKERDDFVESSTKQYSTLPDIFTDEEHPDALANYQASLSAQVAATQSYAATLKALRELGLDNITYQKLLSDGTASSEFANQLLNGGKAAIAGINALDAQLTTSSAALAKKAGSDLFDAGIKIKTDFVNGLKKDAQDIYDAMDVIAKGMIKTLNRRLGIHSPSTEFAKAGKYSVAGFVKGFATSSSVLKRSAEELGAKTLSALQKSMSKISEVVNTEFVMDPTITPVLDLSNVLAGAKTINGLAPVIPITAAASYRQATSISAEETASAAARLAENSAPTVVSKEFKFEQNNYSPESLTDVEIYRQTQNQLAQAKSALGLV